MNKKFCFLILFLFFSLNLYSESGKIGFYINKDKLYKEYGEKKIQELQNLQKPSINVFKQNYNHNIPEQKRNNTKILKDWYLNILSNKSQKQLKELELLKTIQAQKILSPKGKELKKYLYQK